MRLTPPLLAQSSLLSKIHTTPVFLPLIFLSFKSQSTLVHLVSRSSIASSHARHCGRCHSCPSRLRRALLTFTFSPFLGGANLSHASYRCRANHHFFLAVGGAARPSCRRDA
ncbi:hypothetical protein MVEN_00128100 [Mycena venus]|uniref:Uncharacterized protein n=1 Tax=Mycena venus TaxID=2733690 RepID=A0A8H6ZBH6_9AGAR|nr:hypothetical protein MVEN_00128100 [Mycena venus]